MSSSSEAVKRWRLNTKDRMVQAMGGKCQCCGYNKTNKALAFHHIDPDKKDMGFGDTRANPKSWQKIIIELKKCILVCHNCHSEIHDGIENYPSTTLNLTMTLLTIKLSLRTHVLFVVRLSQ